MWLPGLDAAVSAVVQVGCAGVASVLPPASLCRFLALGDGLHGRGYGAREALCYQRQCRERAGSGYEAVVVTSW